MKSPIRLSPGFPDRLRQLRTSAGLSREEMAAAIGVGDITLWRLENGKTSPTLSQLEAMQNAELDVMFLLTGERGYALAATDDDKEWGRCLVAVRKALDLHGLNPSPATYWRLVRLLYTEAINESALKKNVATAIEEAGALAAKEV